MLNVPAVVELRVCPFLLKAAWRPTDPTLPARSSILNMQRVQMISAVITRSETNYNGSHCFTLKRIYFKAACLGPRVRGRLHCRGNISSLCSCKYLSWQSLSVWLIPW